MSPLIPLAIGAGVVYVATKDANSKKASAVASNPSAAIDVGMDAQIASAVHVAVTTETNKVTLTNYAAALKAAGFTNSADAVTARAASL